MCLPPRALLPVACNVHVVTQMWGGRQLFAALSAVDTATRQPQAGESLLKLAAAARAKATALPEIATAPPLLMPALSFCWLLDASNASECDTTSVTDAILGGVPLAPTMIIDHNVDRYETTLAALAAAHPPPRPPETQAPSGSSVEKTPPLTPLSKKKLNEAVAAVASSPPHDRSVDAARASADAARTLSSPVTPAKASPGPRLKITYSRPSPSPSAHWTKA